MDIQLQTSIDFDEKTTCAFVLDATQTQLTGTNSIDLGFTATSVRLAGVEQEKLYACVKEYYNVVRNNSIVNSFNAIIPVEQNVEITVNINLLTKNGLAPETVNIIKNAFESYDPLLGVDAMSYINEQLQGQPVGAPDSFIVKPSYIITKVGASVERREEINQILTLYSGADTSSRLDVFNDQSVGAYLSRRGYTPILIKRENLEGMENQPHDSIREVDSSNPADLDVIIHQQTNGLDCGVFVVEKIRVQTVLAWVELKTEVSWGWKKVGCVPVYWPHVDKLYTRKVIKVLYALVGHPNNFQQYIINQITDCATGSALVSAVIGIALLDLPAAILAFKPLFTQCIISTLNNDVHCLIPDLSIETEAQPWVQS